MEGAEIGRCAEDLEWDLDCKLEWAVGCWKLGVARGGMEGGREAEVDEDERESDGVSVEGRKTRETHKRC